MHASGGGRTDVRVPIRVLMVARRGYESEALGIALDKVADIEVVSVRSRVGQFDEPVAVDAILVDERLGARALSDASRLAARSEASPAVVAFGATATRNGDATAGGSPERADPGQPERVPAGDSLEHLVGAIRRAAGVRAEAGLSWRGEAKIAEYPRPSLTEREKDVLDGVAQGLCNRDIAESLAISVSTVKNHLHSIYTKVGVSSRMNLVRKALDLGMLSSEDLLP